MSDTAGSKAYEPGRVLVGEAATDVGALLKREIDEVLDGNDRAEFLTRIQKWRRLARVEPESAEKTYPWAKASNVVTPILAQKVNTIYAKLVAMFSAKRPFWDVQSDDYELLPVDNAIARMLNYLASAPFHLNLEKVNRSVFYDLPLIGTQIVKVPWLYEVWELKTKAGKVTRTMHNGPAIVPIRIEDFLMRGYFSDMQRAPWVGNMVWLTDAELRQREQAGIYENVEQVLSAFATELDDNWTNELERRGLSASLETGDEHMRLYPVFEGYVFYDADGDGVPEDIKVWLEPKTGTILRSEENLLGVRDYVKLGYFPVPGQVYDIGLGHMLEGLQEEGDFYHNHRADNLHLTLMPIYKRKRGQTRLKAKELHPLAIIDLDDPVGDLVPMVTPDLTASTYQAEMLVRDYADRVSGANDPMSGYADPVMKSGADVGSTMFLAQQGNSILNAIYAGIEDGYGEIGQLILMQLVANKEKVDLSVLDEEDQRLMTQVLDMPLETLPTTFRFKVKTTEINRTEDAKVEQLKQATALFSQYGQQMMQVIALLGNPQVPPLVQQFAQQMFTGATKFTKQVMRSYKIEGVDEMFPDVGGGQGNGSEGTGGQAGGAGSGGGSPAGDGVGMSSGAGMDAGNAQRTGEDLY